MSEESIQGRIKEHKEQEVRRSVLCHEVQKVCGRTAAGTSVRLPPSCPRPCAFWHNAHRLLGSVGQEDVLPTLHGRSSKRALHAAANCQASQMHTPVEQGHGSRLLRICASLQPGGAVWPVRWR